MLQRLAASISWLLTYFRFTGLHIKKAYTSLGTSCPNAHTRFWCVSQWIVLKRESANKWVGEQTGKRYQMY